ncbi:TetR/AcrR family transcriptional regulator [Aestuariispira insulae]|uniref:TetR family transcriptional regulator n=1 Tax=Aestuariispira insulae TaxID=1461337 RepID=A0A3D9HKY3_9PROT|nr:TetR/AcrR family transcriptional regulator [Aestuariispira insulae]RED49961.1 TetR family transcriptional regulator [Aestuariispira insulae]
MAAVEKTTPAPAGISAGNRETIKAKRRRELIESTMDSIAERGLNDTTIADVAKGAGLSRGIVNFHFQSKEILLTETLQHLSRRYRNHWLERYHKAAPDAVTRLVKIFEADFDPMICNPRNLAVWFAFWGEAKSRPVYSELCGERDDDRYRTTLRLCREIIQAGQYDLVPEQMARGLESTAEGLWHSLVMPHRKFNPTEAWRIMAGFLSLCFPRHIGRDGAVIAPVPMKAEKTVLDM